MKKITALFLTLILVFALSACAKTTGDRASKALSNAQHPSEKSVVTNHNPSEETTAPKTTNPTINANIVSKANATTPQSTTNELITRERAIEIVLEKAGLARGSVYELEAELDKERTGTFWEVDFETSEYEYSYHINAETGKIVRSEVTPEKRVSKNTVPKTEPATSPKPTAAPATETKFITRERAIEIALEKAGLARGSVYELEAELDKERTGTFWEVDFETSEYEYSYHINAETSKIVRSEVTPEKRVSKDTVPKTEPATSPKPTTAPATETKFITREQAIEIALEKAGLARGSVYELEAELDKERTGTFWEVDFETSEYEYSYEINAETGTVVHRENERND